VNNSETAKATGVLFSVQKGRSKRNLIYVTLPTFKFLQFFYIFLQSSKLETSNLVVRIISTKSTVCNYKAWSKGRNLSHETCL